MSDPRHDYSNPPEWATPEAWAALERKANLALVRYGRLREMLERDHFGKCVLIDTTTAEDRYVVAVTADELDGIAKGNDSWNDSVMFQIGHI